MLKAVLSIIQNTKGTAGHFFNSEIGANTPFSGQIVEMLMDCTEQQGEINTCFSFIPSSQCMVWKCLVLPVMNQEPGEWKISRNSIIKTKTSPC